jgi:metallo-beta-lactamase class B
MIKDQELRTIKASLCLLALLGCAATPLANRLSSDEVIQGAQNAPLHQWALEGRWNEPFAPFNVIGNIYYVGSATIGSYLITTPDGHFLLDGIMPQTAPQIAANIQALGFDIKDVKYLLNSHAHFYHAGGLAGLQRLSGAKMIASAADRDALERGAVDYGPSAGIKFPPIRVDRTIGDGEKLTFGGVTMVAHMTPGHTAGCTSWSVNVNGADGKSHTAFFHCSSTIAGQSLVPEAYPGIVAAYRSTFESVRSLQADVFLGNHDNFFDLHEKRAKQLAGDANAFVDPSELQSFNTMMAEAFEEGLARQQSKQK